MSSTYNGIDTNAPTGITIPSDGDGPGIKAADVNPALEGTFDLLLNTRKQTVVTVADLAALAAITTPANGSIRHVVGHGFYVFKTSATSGFTPFRIAAGDATPGGWVASETHSIPQGTLAQMTAQASAETGNVFVVTSAGSLCIFRFVAGAAVTDGPYAYPADDNHGTWYLAHARYAINTIQRAKGTGAATLSNATYDPIPLSGGGNLEKVVPDVKAGDLVRVKAVLGQVAGNRRSTFSVLWNDGIGGGDVIIDGATTTIPADSSKVMTALLLGTWIVGANVATPTIKVMGFIDTGAGSGSTTAVGPCWLEVEIIRP